MPGYVVNLSRIWESVLPYAKRHVVYKKNSCFSYEEGAENSFYYIKSGRTGTVQVLEDGCEYIKIFIGEGCLFNETYIIAGFCTSFPFHRCLTDVELFIFDGNLLWDKKFLAAHQGHMQNLYWAMSIKASAHDMVKDIIAKKTVPAKIASWMLMAAQVQKSLSFHPYITQIELGLMLHVHKSSINRTILSMQELGIIGTFSKKLCEIKNLPLLKKQAAGELQE